MIFPFFVVIAICWRKLLSLKPDLGEVDREALINIMNDDNITEDVLLYLFSHNKYKYSKDKYQSKF